MANWLERAKCEIPRSSDQTTANSDDGTPTAVTAATKQAKSEKLLSSIGSNGSAKEALLTDTEETAIRTWLEHIGETDSAITNDVLDKCRADQEARVYFLQRVKEVPTKLTFDDDRRHCHECANFTSSGRCLAAWRGEIRADRTYHPLDDLPRRCEGYSPGSSDSDRCTGRERWPNLFQKGDNHVDK